MLPPDPASTPPLPTSSVMPPRRYVVRKPSGDPAAARRLAAAYDALADAVAAHTRVAALVLDGLGDGWAGHAANARQAPADVVARDGMRVAQALHKAADDLRAYARRLEQAHAHHGWSIGRLVAMGAVVTVGVAAVVVTVGAATAAEAAAAATVVEGAEAAATAAGAAAAEVTESVGALQAALGVLRPLAPFVVPHLTSAASAVTLDATAQLATQHRLDVASLAVSAAVGFGGSSSGALAELRLLRAPGYVRRLGEAASWSANGAVAEYADSGRVDPLDVAGSGLTGVIGRDVRTGVDESWRWWRLRVPQRPLGFDGYRHWRDFVTTLYDGLDRIGYRDAVVVFRGSSVTGVNSRHGWAFDSQRRSDWDLALVHHGAMLRASRFEVPLRGRASRTAALWDRELTPMALGDLTKDLDDIAGRKVSWMVYRDLDAVARRGAGFLVVPRP